MTFLASTALAALVFGTSSAVPPVPVFEEGNVQTRCGGVPVKEFGGTWIYCGAPDIVEVVDSAGRNAALVSRGATVAVDSTFCDGLPLAQQRALWPVQWDLGIKWIRFGSHNDPMNGVRQRLDSSVEGGQTVVRGLMVGDAPVFVAE